MTIPLKIAALCLQICPHHPQEGETIYDPACGTGGMLLAAIERMREKGGNPRTFFGKLYGQEKNLTTASVARMNLLLHGIDDFAIERGDTLPQPLFVGSMGRRGTPLLGRDGWIGHDAGSTRSPIEHGLREIKG